LRIKELMKKRGEVPLFDPFNCRSFGLEKGAPLEESVIEVSLHYSLTICFSEIEEF
jgi:hypothetical protein